jgi:hypothetical protein
METLRIYNRPGGVAHTAADRIAGAAHRLAADAPAEALVERFAVAGPAALGEVVAMEATVHLLDLVAEPTAFIEAATGRSDGAVLPVMR